MKAIVKHPGLAAAPILCDWSPSLGDGMRDAVRIRVAFVGLCRTDLHVADGRIPLASPIVLGHEFSGIVVGAGPLPSGTRVAVNPLFGDRFMGVNFDGALCEEIIVPFEQVHRVPDGLPLQTAAYLEPVAAARAVLKAPLPHARHGAVAGTNRIAGLVGMVLHSEGFDTVPFVNRHNAFDFVVETGSVEETFDDLVDALKPGGLLVLKSRNVDPVPISIAKLVAKEIRVHAVQYDAFAAAMAWLAKESAQMGCLVGNTYALEAFEAAFAEARISEKQKVFIQIGGEQ